MSQISIIIPHKRMPENDRALKLNIDMILGNTKNDFELLIDTESPKDPYHVYNKLAFKARADILVFCNSDTLMAPGWDIPFITHMQDNAILTGYLVEAGNVGVASVNIPGDYGKTPEIFNRSGFENFAIAISNRVPSVIEQRAWYMPCAMRRDWFISTGGFDLSHGGFPAPVDIEFWNHCRDTYGTTFLRVNSVAYHFQALTHRGW